MSKVTLCYTVLASGLDGVTVEKGTSEEITNRANALNENQGEDQTVHYWAGTVAEDEDQPTEFERTDTYHSLAKMVATHLVDIYGTPKGAATSLEAHILVDGGVNQMSECIEVVIGKIRAFAEMVQENPEPFSDTVLGELTQD